MLPLVSSIIVPTNIKFTAKKPEGHGRYIGISCTFPPPPVYRPTCLYLVLDLKKTGSPGAGLAPNMACEGENIRIDL